MSTHALSVKAILYIGPGASITDLPEMIAALRNHVLLQEENQDNARTCLSVKGTLYMGILLVRHLNIEGRKL